ncbi:MAG: hypothetical protein IID37_17405 [Planctomycetes bacterium]|nr:hypothetical protein [Planctomycetota bacterium]
MLASTPGDHPTPLRIHLLKAAIPNRRTAGLAIGLVVAVAVMIPSMAIAQCDEIEYGWTQTFDGHDREGAAVAFGPSGGVVIAAAFTGTVDFDPTDSVDERTSNGDSDIFVTSLGGDGEYQWTYTADMNGDGLVDPLDVGFILARFGPCP